MRHNAGKLQRRSARRHYRGVRPAAGSRGSYLTGVVGQALSPAIIFMAAVGVLTMELRIDHAHSLKEKRHVVRSLKDRLRGRFNVSVSEIDDQDLHNSAVIAAAVVSPSRAFAARVLEAVEEEAAELLGPMLVRAGTEWL